MTYTFLQNYWWVLVSLLGGLLVALMFVQGINVQLINPRLDQLRKRMALNASGRKWELTFTTLVTFGGAFFASFPLFYSTSFGGAYWVWVLLLVTFVFQAVSYEFQHKKGNLLGVKGFRIALIVNGILAPFLVGTAVGTFFTGSKFTVDKAAIVDPTAPVISTWGSPWHGLEALTQPHAVLLGVTLVLLTIILGALYVVTNVDDKGVRHRMRRTIRLIYIPFLLCFVAWLVVLLLMDGFGIAADGTVVLETHKYFFNLVQMPGIILMLLAGVVGLLYGILRVAYKKSRKGFWFAAPGAVLVVMAVFFLAGFNNTPYYPSLIDPQSSLTIRNSSSSYFTLRVMSWVSLLIPFVVAYIAYAWHQMDGEKITVDEIKGEGNKY